MSNNLDNIQAIDRAWNERRWDDYDNLLDDNMIAYISEEGAPHFKAAHTTNAKIFCNTFPDCLVHISPYLQLFESTNYTMTCSVARITGTMTGEMQIGKKSVEPNHRGFDVTFTIICRWRHGKIIERREYFEKERMFAQLHISCWNERFKN
jgi:ketosteroid isomerase-like protein